MAIYIVSQSYVYLCTLIIVADCPDRLTQVLSGSRQTFLTFFSVVPILHRPVLSQHVQGLNFLDHKVATGYHNFDFFLINFVLVFEKSIFQPAPKVIVALGIVPAQVEKLKIAIVDRLVLLYNRHSSSSDIILIFYF